MFYARLLDRKPVPALLALVLSLVIVSSALAQSTVAISGTVADATGGAVSGARVEVVVTDRVVATTLTGADGRYRLQVPAGVPYDIRARREGFADAVVKAPGATVAATHNVTLQVGGISDTLVVTASRGAQSRASVTAATSVITAQEIQALGSTSLVDVMRFVPGVVAEGNGREGGLTSVFSRGGEADYNLVLIDGVRVNQSGGAFDFSRIAAGEIQRVEIVRGAQSSLWGSDAMGAVIQVFTRPEGTQGPSRLTGNVEAGSFDTFRGDARLSGASRRVDYNAGLVRRRTDGAFKDRLREADTFEQAAFDGAVGASLGSRATVRSGVRYSNSQGKSVGNIVYGTNDSGGAYDSTDLSWYLNVGHTAGSRYTGSGTVNYFRSGFVAADTIGDPTFNVYAILLGRPGAMFPDSPRLVRLITQPEFLALQTGTGLGASQFLATTPFGVSDFVSRSETTFRRPAFRYQGDLAWAGSQRTSVGYEYERETNPSVPLFTLENNAVFVQHQVNASDRWFVTAGVRVDDKSMYDTFVSPKLSVGGFLVPTRAGGLSSMKAFFNVGKGIKSPTFGERFGSSFADGNPDLKVERARSTDAGVEMTFVDQRVRGMATWFYNHFQDQVEFRSTSPSFSLDNQADFINIAGSRATGVELEMALQRPAAGVTASAAYTLNDTEVLETVQTGVQFQPGQPLLRRPTHSGNVRVGYERGRVSVHLNARIIGQRHDSAFLSLRSVPNANFPSAVTTDITVNPGYTVVGLGLDIRAHEALSLFVRGDNVGDTAYETALGYPGLPRAFVVGARFNLGR